MEEEKTHHETEKQRLKDIERQDELLAIKLLKQDSSRTLRAVNNKPKRKRRAQQHDNGVKKKKRQTLYILSAVCQEILGVPVSSRPQVVKKIWEYIKGHNLQNANDKRIIMCDETLERLFKRKQVTAFLMNKYLSDHLTRDDDSELVQAAKQQLEREISPVISSSESEQE